MVFCCHTLLPGKDVRYCDTYVCLSVCPLEYLRNHSAEPYQIYYARCLWLRLSPPLTAVPYVMYFRFCG